MAFIRMIAGLGNPGPGYEATRHNVGFMVLDLLAEELGIRLKPHPCYPALWGQVGEVILLKPSAYMNRSGEVIAPLAREYNIKPEEILLVHDDLDLPLGRIRFRLKGSSGGHRGVQSVIRSLGSQDMPRLKIGIGRPERKEDVVDYVLQPFTPQEWKAIKPALLKAVSALKLLLEKKSWAEAMGRLTS